MPPMYDDLWTAAKGMYKTEPAVADGGEVVIYAPHVTEVSHVHGRLIDEIGYHCRDYFLAQWERFKQYPGGILAHSTHVQGAWARTTRRAACETPRIRVTLATGIPRERCERINLGYLDPATVDPDDWRGRRLARGAARRRDAVPGGAAAGVGASDCQSAQSRSNTPKRRIPDPSDDACGLSRSACWIWDWSS